MKRFLGLFNWLKKPEPPKPAAPIIPVPPIQWLEEVGFIKPRPLFRQDRHDAEL